MTDHRQALRGTFTALVTPMNRDGSVDFGALDALVAWQCEQGVEGLVPCGTTGESATLTADERQRVIARVVQNVPTNVRVIAGAGANATAVAVEHQKRAADTGASYALVVTPYYNKPTPQGLYAHYEALLKAANIPIILYNVPGRTGCDMSPETVARIAQMQGIAAIKEATGDLDRVAAIRATTPAHFAVLSGDDPTACPFVWLGGDGLISVSSNVAPGAVSEMIRSALKEDVATSRELHRRLRPLFSALFFESNPIPVKAALAMQGRIGEHYRLPLCPMQEQNRARLKNVLVEGGWLEG